MTSAIAAFFVLCLVLLVISVPALLLSARLAGITPAGWRRATVIVLAMTGLNVALAAAGGLISNWPAVGLLSGLGLLLTVPLVQVGFRAPFRKAVLASLIWVGGTSIPAALLALGFGVFTRLFWVEAFQVPTGALANSIVGFHKEATCPECGYQFFVNASAEADPSPDRAERVVGGVCPNCRYEVQFTPDEPSLVAGDQLLVDKTVSPPFPRYSFVVFRYPGRPGEKWPPGTINYVKRLIGLPGETIAIHAGRLYVADSLFKDQPPDPKADLLEKMRVNDPRAVDLFLGGPPDPTASATAGRFRILRKSPELALAMRHVVFDNDFQPPDADRRPTRWGGKGWEGDGNRPKSFRHPTGGSVDWLRYRHLLQPGRPELITDFIAYNQYRLGSGPGLLAGETYNWAGDLMLEFEAEVAQANDGDELIVELSKGPDRFRARFKPASAECRLTRATGDVESEVSAAIHGINTKGKHAIRFANVDDQLLLWVDGALTSTAPYAAARPKGPTDNDLEPASVGVKGLGARVSGLKLWRDNYYVCTASPPDFSRSESLSEEERLHPSSWAENRRTFPVMTMHVPPGHSLFLGDNSPQSSDSRYWGLVPDSLLIGPVSYRCLPWSRAGVVR